MSERQENSEETLYHFSELGKEENIKKYLRNNNFNIDKKVIDTAIRKCLSNYKKNISDYKKSIEVLLSYADLNYVNPIYNTTLFMLFCKLSDIKAIQLILNQDRTKNHTELNLSICDNNNCNFIFYIINNSDIEDIAIELLKIIFNYNNTHLKKISNEELLLQQDKNGNSPLSLILKKGWTQMLMYYFQNAKYQKSNNNLIHCAIDGKKITNLKIILNYSSLEDLKCKNKDGDTPIIYANKKKYFFMAKIISFYESNFNNEKMKELFIDKPLSPNKILEYFSNKDYNNCIFALNLYKLNQNIIGDINNIPCEWNFILVKKKSFLLKNQNSNLQLDMKTFSNNKNDNKDKQIINSLSEISKFFNKYITDLDIDKHFEEGFYPIDLVVYNKILFYLKIGNIDITLKTIAYYLTRFNPQDEDQYYKIIIYTNVSFILIELFINLNYNEIANIILEKFEKYLIICKEKFEGKEKEKLYENECIKNYLNKYEIFNPFNPNWNDAHCYNKLLKALNNINNLNECKTFLSEFETILKNCKYEETMKIFSRLKLIYKMIKVKINYNNNPTVKSLDKISVLSDLNTLNESKFFFYNSIGIINLKLKKYSFAEMMFKIGINIYKSIILNNPVENVSDNDSILYKSDYLYYMKFNLALSLFYQKKFKEAHIIFKELSNVKIMNQNIYLWYRLGISSLEIYLSKMKKKIIKNEKKKKNEENENKENEIKENNKSEKFKNDFDELFNQFEEEYGNKLINGENNNNQNLKNEKTKKIYLQSIPNNNKYIKYLNESIKAFKNVLYIEKKNNNESITLNINIENLKAIRGILSYYTRSIGEESDFKKKLLSNKKKGNLQIIISSFLNLLFCLSLNKKYTEIILVLKSINKEKWEKMPNDLFIKFQYYKLEAFINLNKIKESYDIINSLINNKNNLRVDNFYLVNDLQLKFYLQTAEIILLCKEKKFKDAENKLINLINELYLKNDKDISQYYSNLLIYIYLNQNKKKEVLEFLKYKILSSKEIND